MEIYEEEDEGEDADEDRYEFLVSQTRATATSNMKPKKATSFDTQHTQRIPTSTKFVRNNMVIETSP